MESFSRFLILGGFVLMLVGSALYLATRSGLPLGHLPGDIRIERDGGGFYFPIASSIVLSIILTVVINILLRIFRK